MHSKMSRASYSLFPAPSSSCSCSVLFWVAVSRKRKSLLFLSIPGVIGVILFVLALITPPLPAAILMLLAPLSEVFSASAAALLALLCRKSA